jgi:hypothetical protein
VTANGPTWRVVIDQYKAKTLLDGQYYALAKFELAQQHALTRKVWDKLSPAERSVRETAFAREFATVGTKESADGHRALVHRHFGELAKKTIALFDSIERAYVAAGRSYFDKPAGGINEAAWTKWVRERGLAQTDEELAPLAKDARFLRGAHFNADAWKTWAEDEALKELRALWATQRTFEDRFVGARDSETDARARELIATVQKQLRTDSTELHERAKLALPESLANPAGLDRLPTVEGISREHVLERRKALLARIGLSQ